jgi:hypothetical protein
MRSVSVRCRLRTKPTDRPLAIARRLNGHHRSACRRPPTAFANLQRCKGRAAYAQAAKGFLAPNENFFNYSTTGTPNITPGSTRISPQQSRNYPGRRRIHRQRQRNLAAKGLDQARGQQPGRFPQDLCAGRIYSGFGHAAVLDDSGSERVRDGDGAVLRVRGQGMLSFSVQWHGAMACGSNGRQLRQVDADSDSGLSNGV